MASLHVLELVEGRMVVAVVVSRTRSGAKTSEKNEEAAVRVVWMREKQINGRGAPSGIEERGYDASMANKCGKAILAASSFVPDPSLEAQRSSQKSFNVANTSTVRRSMD